MGIVRDITTRKIMEADLAKQFSTLTFINSEYKRINDKLSLAQNQILQSEKLASIGLLAAGVAHEINTPLAYVNSNLNRLKNYVGNLLAVICAYEGAEVNVPSASTAFLPVKVLKEGKRPATTVLQYER